MKRKNINITINNSNFWDKSNYIIKSTKNTMNYKKKKEYKINKDIKLINIFVHKMQFSLKKVSNIYKLFKKKSIRVLENLSN